MKHTNGSNNKIAKYNGRYFYRKIDTETGEIVDEFNGDELIKPIGRSGHFYITYLAEIINLIDTLGTKRMEVVKFILKEMDKHNNTLIMTQNEISKKSGISLKTVNDTINQLKKANIIKTRTGAIMFTPKFINNRTSKGEANLILRFEEFSEEKTRSDIIDFPIEEERKIQN